MPLQRGLAAMHAAKVSQGSGGRNGLQFILKPGETALARFYGDFEAEADPVIGQLHYVKRLPPGSNYNNCADNGPEDHAGCVFCFLKNGGDKGVSKGPYAYFFLKDQRKQHKMDNEVKVLKPGIAFVPGRALPPDSYEMTKYPPCVASRTKCMWCAQGNQAKVVGFRYWRLSVSAADQLVSQQAELRNYCRCGAQGDEGTGSISVTRYLCSNPKHGQNYVEVDFFPEAGSPVALCKSCHQSLPPMEEIQCASCDTAARCNLQDFTFKITRTGGGTDTTYNFEAVHPCKPPTEEELAEAEKERPNFEELLAADPAEMQAQKLSVPCPYVTPGHGATQYAPPPSIRPAGLPPGRPVGAPPGKAPIVGQIVQMAQNAARPAPRSGPSASPVPKGVGGFRLPARPASHIPVESGDIPYE